MLPARPWLVRAPGSELPGGFSIHAGVRIEGDDREGREPLLMYAARPAFSEVQLSLLEDDVVELAVVQDDEDDDEAAGDGGEDRYRVAWARLLAKVFDVDAEQCRDCGGRLRPVGAVTRREEARAALAAGLSVLGARGPPTGA